jgi:hypothetical protein
MNPEQIIAPHANTGLIGLFCCLLTINHILVARINPENMATAGTLSRSTMVHSSVLIASGQTEFSSVLPRISRYTISNNAIITPNRKRNNPNKGDLANLLNVEFTTSGRFSISKN